MTPFDPYLNWLGIPVHEQPPNFYRLLGTILFESNPEVIEHAADRQSLKVGAYQGGPLGEFCQQLLSEIAMARYCLLDPQQKAVYDSQLQEALSHRAERAVAAPPPPSSFTGVSQYGATPGTFGTAASHGPPDPSGGLTGPPPIPGPPLPHQAQPLMPSAPAPVMMATPPGVPPPMPAPRPTLSPAPFPAPSATVGATAVGAAVMNAPASVPTPPPLSPPAAPQRPLDELETLTSQSSSGRRTVKRRPKQDYSKEMLIGGIVAGAGVLLFIVFMAVKAQAPARRGFESIEKENLPAEAPAALTAAKTGPTKPKHADGKKGAVAHPSSAGPKEGPTRRPSDTARRSVIRPADRPSPSTDVDPVMPTPHQFGPPTRVLDSPDPGAPVDRGDHVDPPPGERRDTPQGLGGPNDPVFDMPPPPQDE